MHWKDGAYYAGQLEAYGLKLEAPAMKERVLFDRIARETVKTFPREAKAAALAYAFFYRQREQSERFRAFDGLSMNVGGHTCIGVSDLALQRGADYAALIFLHELAHVVHKDHSEAFHRYLDRLISRYNQAAGRSVKNDYSGLAV